MNHIPKTLPTADASTTDAPAVLPDPLPIRPFSRTARLSVTLPGSKSITNRALVLAALAAGTTTLRGALFSRDTRIMVAALRELGFSVECAEAAREITVGGRGGEIPNARASLHVGNAGTAARFLTAMLALRRGGEYALDGDDAMRRRPMDGLLRALEPLGATATAPDGSLAKSFPFTLRTAGLRGGEILADASASSQILSALLLVAPLAPAPLRIRLAGKTVSEPFVEMTLRLMSQFGAPPPETSPTPSTPDAATTFAFRGNANYHSPAYAYDIEPDATAASYFLALPLAAPVSVLVRGLRENSLQGDTAFAKILRKIGLDIRTVADGFLAEKPPAPSASPRATPPASAPASPPVHAAVAHDFNAVSDTFLTLAALAPLLPEPLSIRGVAHARRQETDRLLAVAVELERLGQRVEPSAAALRADPSIGDLTIFPDLAAMRRLSSAAPLPVRTYEDHRMAMSFAILGTHDLHGDGRPWLAIEDPACCGKTFPDFFDVLAGLQQTCLPVCALFR
ncbi:MAG: 3-phosphoshikimate 1-carboxyvinyltransferase [Puniceicoccales bacterium]|jgi:3-phosphoshikimate 1-carboxyvinyltransferase|nr:3-phosphoshikimate 1-carboxyvinyltransferase [Puniceicoccales bacterium]